MTVARAKDIVLRKEIAIAACVLRLVKVPLTGGQFDALGDFLFNFGAGRLVSSTLVRDLNAGKYDVAASQLVASDHAGGVEVEGLKARREAEVALSKG